MSAGSQFDHDRAFDELGPAPDDDTIRADCGHWESESRCDMIEGRVICPQCADDPIMLKRIAARMELPTRVDDYEVA